APRTSAACFKISGGSRDPSARRAKPAGAHPPARLALLACSCEGCSAGSLRSLVLASPRSGLLLLFVRAHQLSVREDVAFHCGFELGFGRLLELELGVE